MGNKADLTPITPDYTVAKERAAIGMRVNATMLFAAGVSVFADVVCLSKQVSVTTHNTLSKPGQPHDGAEGNRTPVQNIGVATYMSFKVIHQD